MKQNPITKYFNIHNNTISNNTITNNTISNNTISNNTISNTISNNTISNNTISNNTISNNTISNNILIYTDGACSNNGKKNAKAGIGIYIENMYNISERLHGKQTNQRAELYAILKSLKLINIKNYNNIIIYTDSQYSINCITKWIINWIKNDWKDKHNKNVKNKDLIEPIYNICKTNNNIKFKHILAHTNLLDCHSLGNNKADILARQAIK